MVIAKQMYPVLTQPNISIVICNYNYAQYIAYAIESALAQTYPAFEVVIIDDGSTDDSVNVIKSFQQQVKLVQKTNGGQVSAYNAAMAHISGDVIIFLDADDALLPDALAQIATTFDKNVVKTHFKLSFIDQHGNSMAQTVPRNLDSGDCAKGLQKHGLLYNSAPASGNAYRLQALQKLFPLPILAGDKHGADFYCIYGIVFQGAVNTVDQVLGQYRVHIAEGADGIAYGNSLKGLDLAKTLNTRWQAFRSWLVASGVIKQPLPTNFIDFSQQKLLFSDAMIQTSVVGHWFSPTRAFYPDMLKSIYLRQDFTLVIKLALIAWATVMLISPKRLQFFLAKKVCNPLSS